MAKRKSAAPKTKSNSRSLKNSEYKSRTTKAKSKKKQSKRKKAVARAKKVGRVGLEAYLTYSPNGSKRRIQLNTLKRVIKS
ncbi:hypothetical protein JOD17_002903 [Geomicrobium sediminis]|uniref:Uncharacterized protein n=1 Tax=Geomicrobium sediminis TaxID=1347788 RepID=A0ABS2PEW4_9BACL|nr:hypothetical protein [Geomicrobium sediminis]